MAGRARGFSGGVSRAGARYCERADWCECSAAALYNPAMPFRNPGPLELYYEEHGDPAAPAAALLVSLGLDAVSVVGFLMGGAVA